MNYKIQIMIEYKRVFLIFGCYAVLLIGPCVWAGIPSRPNMPLTGASKQKSALPTAASNLKGQVGGATNPNQKSIGSLGGPSTASSLPTPSVKSNVSPEGGSQVGSKTAATQN